MKKILYLSLVAVLGTNFNNAEVCATARDDFEDLSKSSIQLSPIEQNLRNIKVNLQELEKIYKDDVKKKKVSKHYIHGSPDGGVEDSEIVFPKFRITKEHIETLLQQIEELATESNALGKLNTIRDKLAELEKAYYADVKAGKLTQVEISEGRIWWTKVRVIKFEIEKLLDEIRDLSE